MDTKILEKIQKLLCLAADNPEAHESKLAAERAADLMAKYNVGIEDVDSHGKMKEGSVIEQNVDTLPHFHQIWESALGSALCDCFDCKRVIYTEGRKIVSRNFIGSKSDVQLAVWFYKYLRLRIVKQAEKLYKKQQDQKSFGLGAVSSLEPRLKGMYKRKAEATPVDSRALVLTKQVAVQDYFDSRYGGMKSRSYGTSKISQAYYTGVEEGQKMSINQQVGA